MELQLAPPDKLTRYDYFAGLAMSALIRSPGSYLWKATEAVEIAEALIAEIDRRREAAAIHIPSATAEPTVTVTANLEALNTVLWLAERQHKAVGCVCDESHQCVYGHRIAAVAALTGGER